MYDMNFLGCGAQESSTWGHCEVARTDGFLEEKSRRRFGVLAWQDE